MVAATLPHWFEFRYPTILPVAILAIVLATLLCTAVAHRLGTGRRVAWLLMASLGFILALTIAPSRQALTVGMTGPVACDLSRIGPASLATYARMDDPFLNILVFVPFGLAVGLLPAGRAKWSILVAAVLLSPAIETTQALVVAMGRSCESGDIFDNLFGLAIGVAVGLLARAALRRRGASA